MNEPALMDKLDAGYLRVEARCQVWASKSMRVNAEGAGTPKRVLSALVGAMV
jgi:hypothetical protein